MKALYWRQQKLSKIIIGFVACFSLVTMYFAETLKTKHVQVFYKEKISASKIAQKAFKVAKRERLKKKHSIDSQADPTKSGIMGKLMTPITSGSGDLLAKQTSINPNFAAVVIHFLKQTKVKKGDLVAVAVSGSFPAINIAVYAAIQALGLKPVIISSVAASQWGANISDFTWLDMEHLFYKRGIFTFRSVAASIGGVDDVGIGMDQHGKQLILNAISRNKIALLDAKDSQESLEKRMNIYNGFTEEQSFRVYINVGGGTVSVGRKIGKRLFHAGLNRTLPPGTTQIDSVMKRFVQEKVPAIHLVRIQNIAKKFGLPFVPKDLPRTGEGEVFVKKEYNMLVITVALLLVILSLFVFLRSDIGPNILSSFWKEKA